MKKSLLYGIIVLVLASLSQEAVAMKWANGFRLGMKTAQYGALIATPMYLTYKLTGTLTPFIDNNIIVTVEPEVEKFVLNTLHESYPELKDRTVRVIKYPKGAYQSTFAAAEDANTSYICVPVSLNNAELELAQQFKSEGLQRMSDEEFEAKSKQANFKKHQLMAMAQFQGVAVDANTLDIWRETIRHEGSHILHHDILKNHFALLSAPIVGLYGTEKIKNLLGLKTLFSNRPILGNLLKGFGYIPSFPLKIAAYYLLLAKPAKYWAEYRADQDAIKRTQDPAEIKAQANAWANLPEHPPVLKIIDPHPEHKARAKYFAEAAQKLEEKQAQQSAAKD